MGTVGYNCCVVILTILCLFIFAKACDTAYKKDSNNKSLIQQYEDSISILNKEINDLQFSIDTMNVRLLKYRINEQLIELDIKSKSNADNINLFFNSTK